MPFPENRRLWLRRAFGGKSMEYTISEKAGLKRSNLPIEEIHHIDPESKLLFDGSQDPNRSDPLPLTKKEHRGLGLVSDDGKTRRLALPFERGHSFHPDIGQALEDYRHGDKKAFKKATDIHREKATQGKRITNTDEATDEWYREQSLLEIQKYARNHPEDPVPKVRNHLKFKKKNWWDIFTGERKYEEDDV